MDYYVVVDHWFFICIFLLDICMKDPSSLKNESLKGRVLSLRNRTAGPDEDGKMLTCDKCGRAIMYRSNRSFNMPPPGIWHLCRPGEDGIWLSESSSGWGIWSLCFRSGEFELHPRCHVKSLAQRAIMWDAVLEDFRGKDCAFVANFKLFNWIQALNVWMYFIVVFTMKYNTYTGDSIQQHKIK